MTDVAVMVERVARAICHIEGGRITGPSQCRATREFGWKGDGEHFDLYVEAHWKEYIGAAECAIQALREPTHFMLARGSDEIGKPPKTLPEAWRTMIDEALGDQR